MTKIVDPGQLIKDTEITIDTTAFTIQLEAVGNMSAASPGSTSGVTMQAVYSALKDFWKDDDDYNKFKFPLKSFTKNEFLWINGWAPADATTRTLIRDAGWQEINNDLYAGFISLGQFDDDADQGYYAQVAGDDPAATPNFDKTGNINEAVLVDDDSAGVPGDLTGYFKAFLREEQKLYSSYDLLFEQGIAALEATLYRFPLSNAVDINATITDADIVTDASGFYAPMDITYYLGQLFESAAAQAYVLSDVVQDVAGRWAYCSSAGTLDAAGVLDYNNNGGTGTFVAFEGERLVGLVYYPFTTAVDGNLRPLKEVYSWSQRQLRQTGDINDGAATAKDGIIFGNVADELSSFVGSDIVMEQGVFLDQYAPTDVNNIILVPEPIDGGVPAEIEFPFEVVVTMNMPANVVLEGNTDTRGVAYFTDDSAGDNALNNFNLAGAIIVQDNGLANVDFTGTEIDAGVPNAIVFSYDYTFNVQRGAASAGEDAPITLQLCGLAGFEVGTTEFIISEVSNLTVNIVAADERNYI